jgi:high-affinity Fe2+/Pb2+ permease
MPYRRRFIRAEGDWFRKRQRRALRAVLLIGLVCAALLVLLVYWYCHRKAY